MRFTIRKGLVCLICLIICMFVTYNFINVVHAEEKEYVRDYLYWGYSEESSTLYISPVETDLTQNRDDRIMKMDIEYYLDEIIKEKEPYGYYYDLFLIDNNENVSNVVFIENENYALKPYNMVGWFTKFTNLQKIYGFEYVDSSECKDFSYLFSGCKKLEFDFIDYLNTSFGERFISMFRGCDTIISSDIFNKLDLTNAIDLSSMFEFCNNMTEFVFKDGDYSEIQRMDSMFGTCQNLKEIDFGINYFQSCFSTSGMFQYCAELSNIDFSRCSFPSVSDMSNMFVECWSLKNIDLSNFIVNNDNKIISHNVFFASQEFECKCPSLKELFFGCTSLESVIMPKNVYKPYDFDLAFNSCIKLKTIDLSNLDASRLTNLDNVFTYCQSLETIIVDKNKLNFVPSDIELEYTLYPSDWLFNECYNLVGGKGTTYDENHIGNEYAHIDEGPDNPGYFTDIADYKPLDENDKRVDTKSSNNIPIIIGISAVGILVIVISIYLIRRRKK